MGRVVVSVQNESWTQLFSAEFPTQKSAKSFIEWRIEELLAQGAKHVIMVDMDTHTQSRYCATAIADGIFAALKTDWRYALVRKSA